MKPNIIRYRYTRYSMWVGSFLAMGLRFVAGLPPAIAIGGFAVVLGIGLFIDLVIRKA
jgi:hypothetical protein